MKYLLQHGADLSVRDSYQCQAIHYASKNGQQKCLELILDKDPAQLNSTDKYGWTPLHFCASNKYKDSVKYLVEHHAQITKDQTGRTPLDIAQVFKFVCDLYIAKL